MTSGGRGVGFACLGTVWWFYAGNSTRFFKQSQLLLYHSLFISFCLFFTGHWNPETLEPRISVYLSRSTSQLISTFSKIRDVVSIFVHTAARATLLSCRGAAARSTPLTAPVVAILSWTDRGHHVPALTVTSSGRGVGFDMHAWGRLDHRALEATFQPSSFFPFSFASFVLPPWPSGLAFLSGSWQPSKVYRFALLDYWDDVVSSCSMSLRTQAWPAIEFVSGKEGLRPL